MEQRPPLPGYYRVYMFFQYREGWCCQFLEPDLKTSLPRTLTFQSVEKLRTLIERGRGFVNDKTKREFERGLANGRGSIYLTLDKNQYSQLHRRG